MEDKPIKIIHIISSLEKGGAQGLMFEIIKSLEKPKYEHLIISLKTGNAYAAITASKSINLISLNLSPYSLLSSFKKILKTVKEFKPNVIQSWMYHADFLTIILKPLLRNIKIIWSFHHAHPKKNKSSSIFIAKFCSHFSSFIPDAIIACSDLTMREHIDFGYSANKIIVINNGVNEKRFKYNPKIPLSRENPVIGFIGRWHPIKGHKTFIKAAKILSKEIISARFIMIGSNIDQQNHDLNNIIKANDLAEKIELYGEEEVDIRKYYEMIDIYICSSWSESFSLTIVESALQGIPIISTDVGIVREIINDDLINQTGDSEGIANSVMKLIEYNDEKIETQLKDSYQRAINKFTLDRMLRDYEAVYENHSLVD